MDHRFNGGTAGILGLEHNPFLVMADPNAARLNVRDITPPTGISAKRVGFRRRMLGAIDRLERHATIQPAAYHALDEHYKTALNMITAPETKRAFEIETRNDRASRPVWPHTLWPELPVGSAIDRGGRAIRHHHRYRMGHAPEQFHGP